MGTATKHFDFEELLINQTEKPSIEILHNLKKVAQFLEVYREKIFKNQPIKITSGWRSPEYNKKIGGAENSMHCKGLAVDFLAPAGFTVRRCYELLDIAHQGGLERANTWVHIDLRPTVIRFDNNNKILASHFDINIHDKLFKGVKL